MLRYPFFVIIYCLTNNDPVFEVAYLSRVSMTFVVFNV